MITSINKKKIEIREIRSKIEKMLEKKFLFKNKFISIIPIKSNFINRHILNNQKEIDRKKIKILLNIEELFNHDHNLCTIVNKKNILYRIHKKRMIIIFECYNAKVVLSHNSKGDIFLISVDSLKTRQIVQYKRNHFDYYNLVNKLDYLWNQILKFSK